MAEIRDEFLDGLRLMYPSLRKEDFVAFKLTKVREIMPVTTLNYSRELLPSTDTSQSRIFVVNSAQIVDGTWNVNEIIRLAKRKATEIAETYIPASGS